MELQMTVKLHEKSNGNLVIFSDKKEKRSYSTKGAESGMGANLVVSDGGTTM